MPTLTFRLVNFIGYLPLKLLFVWILLRFRSCSCLTFAACFAAASSSGAYVSNFSKSFTAPSFTVAVFSFFFSSLYKSPLSLAKTLFCFSSLLFLILKAMISVSFFFPEKGIFQAILSRVLRRFALLRLREFSPRRLPSSFSS